MTQSNASKSAQLDAAMAALGKAVDTVVDRERQRQRDFEEYLPAFQNVINRRQEMKSRGQDDNGGDRED